MCVSHQNHTIYVYATKEHFLGTIERGRFASSFRLLANASFAFAVDPDDVVFGTVVKDRYLIFNQQTKIETEKFLSLVEVLL